MKSLIIMRGLPRSGKSSTAAELSQKLKAGVLNLDKVREVLCKQVYCEDEEPSVWLTGLTSLFGAIKSKDILIVDESNPSLLNIQYWANTEAFNCIFIVDLCNYTSKDTCLSRTDKDYLKAAIIRKDGIMHRDTEKIKEFSSKLGFTYIDFKSTDEAVGIINKVISEKQKENPAPQNKEEK